MSFPTVCADQKKLFSQDVLDEFITRTEETLSENNAGKQLVKIEKDIRALEAKRAKLVDMRLEEVLDKETYESKYLDLTGQIEQLQAQRRDLQEAAETENTMKKRIAEFRKTLEQNNVLEEFDRYIFESIVEKVIVGGYDEEGRKDPAKLIFIYKTGFQSHMDGANFKPPRKNSKSAKQAAGLCSHPTDKVETTCSHHSDDTCGVRSPADPDKKNKRGTGSMNHRKWSWATRIIALASGILLISGLYASSPIVPCIIPVLAAFPYGSSPPSFSPSS